MNSEEKNQNSSENNQLSSDDKNNHYSKINKNEEKNINNQLIKPIPIPINPILMKQPSNDVSTHLNSSVILNNINQDSNMPIMYQQYQRGFPSRQNSSFEDNYKYTFIQSKDSKNIENIENNNILTFQKYKLCCSCTKTKCIKKYCECFANKRFCKDCKCQDCLNKFDINNNCSNQYLNENEIINCTCSKSNCNKKYCDCYKSRVKCNEKCRCVNCMNPINQIQNNLINSIINNDNNIKNINDNNINKEINLEENNKTSRNSSFTDNLNDKFKIQRISVFINKNQTLINVDKFSKEEMKLLSKKRRKDKKINTSNNK